jgi:FkbM family methyltransferase
MKIGKGYDLRRLFAAAIHGKRKAQFSQFGEDRLIIRHFQPGFSGTYVDIGAYDPFQWSNTAYLWMRGWNGINIDANRTSIERFEKRRPADRNVWAAVVPREGWHEGATVSFRTSEHGISTGGRVVFDAEAGSHLTVPAITLDHVADMAGREIDFLNIDIEGLDEVIVLDPAIERLSPQLLAIEQYGDDVAEILGRPASRRLADLGYAMVGRVHITSLYSRRRDRG